MLFRKKPKQEKPDAFYVYTQTENYKGFKRIKLSSYGYQPALDGIRRLADADLSGAEIKISVFGGDSPRAVVSVGKDIAGTIWQRSFDKFSALKNGKVSAVRLEIRDGDAYLFYKVNSPATYKKPLKSKIKAPKTQKNRSDLPRFSSACRFIERR